MSDLIDRQAAIDAVGNMLRRKFGIGGDLAEITLAGLPSAQPTVDAVPVIRCKDCKWYYRGGATCMFWDGANGMCGDDFCGKAERKEE